MTRNILVLSDIHVGSLVGLLHPKNSVFSARNGDELRWVPNKTQMALWYHWKKMLAAIAALKLEAIIINGDVCEGPQRSSQGLYTITSDMKYQADLAVQLLETLPKKVPKYFTQGTFYHSVEDRPIEQYIAERLDAEFGDDLIVEAAGIRAHCSHHESVSSSSWQYRTTPIARDLLLTALHDAEDKYGKIDAVIRSHAHYFVEVQFKSQLGLITPCWQARGTYSVKKNIISPPDIGWLIMKIEHKDCIAVDKSGVTHIGRPSRVVGSG